jgi:nucleoprotein TPR
MNEIEWLNSELEKKSSLMLQSRSEYNKKSFEFDSKLDDLTAENKKLKSLNDSLQSANQSMEQQIDDLTTKLHEIRDKYAQARLDFEEESQSREKIIKLYQEEAQSSKQKLDDASQAITELNQMVLEIRNEYSNLLDEKTTIETAFESKLKENTEIIAKLEQELKNANELLSIAKRKGATVLSEADIEQLSPAAAVASRLLKNGMTLTQIYSEYVNLAEALQTQKTENQRLTSYINEIVREIDEKAPVLKRQKCEYEEAVKTIDSLTNQLENAMMDYEVLKSKSEDSIKKYNLVSSENIRFRQDCNDLSRQVTVLLHEVEKLRSKLMNASRKSTGNTNSNNLNASSSEHNVSAYSETNESLAEVTSSSEIVSKDILLFRNIEELQKQNQKLVRLLHEVTDKKQSEEKNELEQKTKEYNEKLNLALRELDEFKIQREKHEQVLDEIRKQRDTYKQLLNSQQHQQLRNGSSNQQQQSQQHSSSDLSFYTSTPGGHGKIAKPLSATDNLLYANSNDKLKEDQNRELHEKTVLLEKLQKQFDAYQTEMMQTNKLLNEEADTYRSSNSELNMKLALSDSRLESTVEKCKSLNTAIEKLRKELETQKERNSKLNELIIKHEQSLSITSQESNRAQERVCELETKLHNMTFERDMLKSNHDRIVKERDMLVQENNSRSSILTNLEMIKNSCERNERETKLIYTQKIEQLERECHIQRKQLEQDQEKHEVLVKSWKSQYEQLQIQDEKEKEEHERTRKAFAEQKQTFTQLKEKCDELEAKLHSNELIVQMTRNTKSSSAISRLTHLVSNLF